MLREAHVILSYIKGSKHLSASSIIPKEAYKGGATNEREEKDEGEWKREANERNEK